MAHEANTCLLLSNYCLYFNSILQDSKVIVSRCSGTINYLVECNDWINKLIHLRKFFFMINFRFRCKINLNRWIKYLELKILSFLLWIIFKPNFNHENKLLYNVNISREKEYLIWIKDSKNFMINFNLNSMFKQPMFFLYVSELFE